MKSPPSIGVSAPNPLNTPIKGRQSPSAAVKHIYTEDVRASEKKDGVDVNTLWQEADEMWRMCKDVDSESDADDDFYAAKVRPVMAKLPGGDIHVCMAGCDCPFIVTNEDSLLVCAYTGVLHGSESVNEFFDLCGGIGKKSGDPDANCGEPAFGRFVKRVDPLAASKTAFKAASQFEDSDITGFFNSTDTCDKKPPKRGALCVGEVSSIVKKRQRTNKKCVDSISTCSNLVSEAESVYVKLIDFDKAAFSKRGEGSDSKSVVTDHRMKSAAFVRTAALRRYTKQCVDSNVAPCLDEMHNLCIQAQNIAKQARESEVNANQKAIIRTTSFRGTVAKLIVTLWINACSSPYMLSSPKRGTDAFRPFVCGCLFAMKRGLRLSDGSVIVPVCNMIASALPVLRGTGSNTIAKTLHSSSHRGICTLSRCISSLPTTQQREHFQSAILSAQRFSAQQFSASDI